MKPISTFVSRLAVAALTAMALIAASAPAAAQEKLTRAKELYASASYEEALQALGTVPGRTSAIESTEVAAYQVFCLLALGRSDEAKQAIEAIVHSDPLFHPSEGQASPRLRTFFEDVRRPMLPDVVRQSYARGKEAYGRKDATGAMADFDRVIALIDEMGEAADPGVADLRTLAQGFRDLSAAAPKPTPPAASPAPAAAAAPPASGPPAGPAPSKVENVVRVYSASDEDVVKPTAVSRILPNWNPVNAVQAMQEFRGVLEVVIGENGLVTYAVITKPVNPAYDPLLIRAARDWKFKPATKDGVPVRYLLRMDIHLAAKR
jgi:tetratricopeptide (TPR) repeat protein